MRWDAEPNRRGLGGVTRMRPWSLASASVVAAVLSLTSPASAGPPFRTDDPEPLDYQHFEINLFSTGTQTTGGWSGALPALEVNYGALPNFTVHAIVPQGYAAPTGAGTGFALGDIELGTKYTFLTPGDDDWFPQAAVYPLIEVPAGNQKLGLSTGHAQIFLPLWLEKVFDPWTVYGGGGYWINPGVGNKNYSFVGVALWRKVTEAFNVGIELFHQTSPGDGVKESTGFNLGAIYDFSDNWHLLASAGTGLQNRSDTNQFSYYLAVRLTF
jgi:hypothetical protein